MSTTSGVTNDTSNSQSTTQSTPQKALDRNAFLKLMITELQNQDPLNPMDNTEYISQLAQFSSLEQMQNVNDNLSVLINAESGFSALNLIGKKVNCVDPDNTEKTISGKVDTIKFVSGTPVITINEREIPLSYVTSVSL
jgi:flagellar basal-body rod modification protein FlgD